MLAKYWKKILLVIVVILCLFNIVKKLVFHPTIKDELKASAQYVVQEKQNEKNK